MRRPAKHNFMLTNSGIQHYSIAKAHALVHMVLSNTAKGTANQLSKHAVVHSLHNSNEKVSGKQSTPLPVQATHTLLSTNFLRMQFH
jgi:hypothetical protein